MYTPNPHLIRERKLRGWSQSFLGGKIGVDGNSVSRWESGRVIPSPYYQEKLCELFGKTAEELGFLQPEDPSSLVLSSQSDEKAGSEHSSLVTVQAAIPSIQSPHWIEKVSATRLPNSKQWITIALVAVLISGLLIVVVMHFQPGPDNSLRGWPESNSLDGLCDKQRDGGYEVVLRNSYWSFYKCPSNITTLANFKLNVQMRFVSGNGGGGILFRATPQVPADHFYYFYIRPDKSWGLQKDTPGGNTKPTSLASGESNNIHPDDINTLSVVASGDEISLSVNGVSLAQKIHDKTYSQGAIWVAAGSGPSSRQSQVLFFDMQITPSWCVECD